MKSVYWQPRRVGRPALVLMALLSIGGLLLVESHRRRVPSPTTKKNWPRRDWPPSAWKRSSSGGSHLGYADRSGGRSGRNRLDRRGHDAGHQHRRPAGGQTHFGQSQFRRHRRRAVETGRRAAGRHRGDRLFRLVPRFEHCRRSRRANARPAADRHFQRRPPASGEPTCPNLLWLDMERTLYDEGKIALSLAGGFAGGRRRSWAGNERSDARRRCATGSPAMAWPRSKPTASPKASTSGCGSISDQAGTAADQMLHQHRRRRHLGRQKPGQEAVPLRACTRRLPRGRATSIR